MKKLALLLPCLLSFGACVNTQSFEMVKADGLNELSVTVGSSFVESSSYNASVYLKATEEINTISIEIHFNSDVLAVNTATNSYTSSISDYTIHDDYLSYSYVFNSSFPLNLKKKIFGFNFQIKDGVTPGNYYFDTLVTGAYNSSLESVDVLTSRNYFNVSSKNTVKSSRVYANGYSISTSYNNEFSFSCYLNNSEPASGSFVIQYDYELFEFVSLTIKNFFDNMIYDYNASTLGEIRISFVEDIQDNNTSLFEVQLRTIANIKKSSKITVNASELFDSDMNPMTFTSASLTASISYDSSYETHPAVTTSAVVDTDNHQVVFTINLQEDSHLGAGDFTFSFDRDVLTYVGYQKLFFPNYFPINDKQTELNQGRVKFSILSTTDIVTGGDILALTFSYADARNNRNSSVSLTGSDLTDSLTEPIVLDISGANFTILGVDLVAIWADSYLYMDDPSFVGDGSGRCISDGLYETAKQELIKLDSESINDFKTNADNRYTAELARYTAWATANHDTKPFETNYDFLNASAGNLLPSQNNNDQLSNIVVAVSLLIVGMCGVAFVVISKKKKKQK